jgi:hypothetical protein
VWATAPQRILVHLLMARQATLENPAKVMFRSARLVYRLNRSVAIQWRWRASSGMAKRI